MEGKLKTYFEQYIQVIFMKLWSDVSELQLYKIINKYEIRLYVNCKAAASAYHYWDSFFVDCLFHSAASFYRLSKDWHLLCFLIFFHFQNHSSLTVQLGLFLMNRRRKPEVVLRKNQRIQPCSA